MTTSIKRCSDARLLGHEQPFVLLLGKPKILHEGSAKAIVDCYAVDELGMAALNIHLIDLSPGWREVMSQKVEVHCNK